MASIEIDVRKILKILAKSQANLSDLSPFFKNVADLELSQTMMRFKNEVDPEGIPWPEPITIRRDGGGGRSGGYTQEQSWNYVLKSRFHAAPPGWHFFDGSRDKVLTDTGTLRRSLGIASGKDYAIVGTNLEYAQGLQRGRFPFLGINGQTEKNVNTAMSKFLKGILK